MHKAIHLRDDIGRLYVSRKEGALKQRKTNYSDKKQHRQHKDN